MAEVVFSPTAGRDLNEAADHIAIHLQNPSAAARLMQRIRKDTAALGMFPDMGTPVPRSGNRVIYRYILCGNYIVFYFVEENTVRIARILYGRRDYLTLLLGDQAMGDEIEL